MPIENLSLRACRGFVYVIYCWRFMMSNSYAYYLGILWQLQVAGSDRSSIILPLSGLKQFHEIVGHFVEITKDRIEGMTGANVRTVDPPQRWMLGLGLVIKQINPFCQVVLEPQIGVWLDVQLCSVVLCYFLLFVLSFKSENNPISVWSTESSKMLCQA